MTESPPPIITDGDKNSPAALTRDYIMPIIQSAASHGFNSIIVSFFGFHHIVHRINNDKLNFYSPYTSTFIYSTNPLNQKDMVEVLIKSGYVVKEFEKTTLNEMPHITISWGNFEEMSKINALFYTVASDMLFDEKQTVEVYFRIIDPGHVLCLTPLSHIFRNCQLDLNTLIDQRHSLGYKLSYRLDDQKRTIIVATITKHVAISLTSYLQMTLL